MTTDGQTFDFVIAGGGSAGCVLANRLSEDPSNKVCLLEAGGEDKSPLIKVPLGIMFLIDSKVYNWRYRTSEQANASNRQSGSRAAAPSAAQARSTAWCIPVAIRSTMMNGSMSPVAKAGRTEKFCLISRNPSTMKISAATRITARTGR